MNIIPDQRVGLKSDDLTIDMVLKVDLRQASGAAADNAFPKCPR